jgi:hypothetical protein
MASENETVAGNTDATLDKKTLRILGLSILSAFFFALGGVATAAQEFVVWIPLRLTGLLILAGLTLGLVAMVRAARVLFVTPPTARIQLWRLVWSLFFGVLPPLVFLVWAFLQNGLLGALL